MLTKINLDKSNFWIDSKGILYCKHLNCDKNWKLNSNEVKKHILAILTLACNKPKAIIVDFRNVRGICAILAARLFTKDYSIKQIIISEAFIVNGLVSRILVYVHKRIYEPKTTFKIFNNIKDAKVYSLKQLEGVKESIKDNNNKIKPSNPILTRISVG